MHTGDVRWQYNVGADGANQFHSTALITDSLVIVGTDEGTSGVGFVYAFNKQTGDLRWRTDGDLGVPSSPAHTDSLIIVITVDDDLLAMHETDGTVVWRFNNDWIRLPMSPDNESMIRIPRISSSPVAYHGRVYVAGRDSTIRCLDMKSGSVAWEFHAGATLTTDPLLIDSLLWFGFDDYTIRSFSSDSGIPRSVDTLDLIPTGALTRNNSTIAFLGAQMDNRPHDLIVIDAENRCVQAQYQLTSEDPGEYWYVPRLHVFHEKIIAGSTGGLVVAYDPAIDSTTWELNIDQPVRGIGHSGDILLIGGFNGLLRAVEIHEER